MVAQRPESGRGADDKQSREPKAEAASLAAAKGPGSPLQAWLPLIAASVLMPVLAYVMTSFVLIPKMQKALRASPGAAVEAGKESHAETTNTGTTVSSAGENHSSVTLNKLLVNVAGTMGSRYLLTSITMVGDAADFSGQVAQHEPQLRDMASGILNTKTIADLEKPGARNLIRGELLAGFNTIMGKSAVREIYFTEFAIQ